MDNQVAHRLQESGDPSGTPPYVVRITGKKRDGSPFHGTGFLITEGGHVATCAHVIRDAVELKVTLPLQKPWTYEVLDWSELEDIALLRGKVPPTAPTPFAR